MPKMRPSDCTRTRLFHLRGSFFEQEWIRRGVNVNFKCPQTICDETIPHTKEMAYGRVECNCVGDKDAKFT